MNIVVLRGNLTRDPEVKQLNSGTSVGKFSIAVNRRYKDSKGDVAEETSYFDCEIWGKPAENLGKLVQKGSGILIEGSLKQERWEVEGDRRSKVIVKVTNFHLLDRKGSNQSAADREEREAATAAATNASDGGQEQMDDDIPF